MIDIHHHLLWGLDDGASSIETSVEMARMAAEDGITHVVCTPHANGHYEYRPEAIDDKLVELRQRLESEGIRLTLGRGCDFHMSYENIQTALENPTRFSINGLGYLLVEIPDYGIPAGLTEVFYQMRISGLTPILTHPERNRTLQADREMLLDWMRGGILVQVTAGSVTGRMGRSAEKMAHELLENRWVHFLATDAHNITSRPPKMREAMDAVAERYGKEYADLLCTANPMAAFQGAPMPQQMESLNLYPELEEKNWWQRMLGR